MDNNKSIGITAVLNNPKLAQQVKDALASDPGSSKRTNAVAVLRAINRSAQNGQGGMMYDGQGGPLGVVDQPFQGSVSVGTQQPSPQLQVQQPQQQPQLQVQQPQPSQPLQVQPASPSAGLQSGAPASSIQGAEAVMPTMPSSTVMFQAAPTKKESPYPTDAMTQTGEPEDFGTYYEKQSPEFQSDYAPVIEMVEAGVGPQTFAWTMMADINKLRQIPEFKDIPAEMLPAFGASVTRQVADISDRLKEENQITQQQDNLTRLSERGLSIESDLNNYVNARDKYVKNLDGMIDTAKDSMLGMDMANPEVAKRMNNYMNYLYIMKGRQNKRYADYMDSSIMQHNLDITRAQNAYNTSYDRFKEELATKKATTEEDYTRMNAMLQEMYANVEGREQKELQMDILRSQAAEARADATGDAFSRMSDTEKNSVEIFEQKIGRQLPDFVWRYIIENLTPQQRSRFLLRLEKALQENSDITQEDMIQLVDDYIRAVEKGTGTTPENRFTQKKEEG